MIDLRIFVAIGDVLLNMSAAWFGAAFIIPNTYNRTTRDNLSFVTINIILGIMALAVGYKFRILGV